MLRIFDLSRRKFVKWNENEDQKASILSMNANLRMHEKQAGVYRGDIPFKKALMEKLLWKKFKGKSFYAKALIESFYLCRQESFIRH